MGVVDWAWFQTLLKIVKDCTNSKSIVSEICSVFVCKRERDS